jgi:hypothetical protein
MIEEIILKNSKFKWDSAAVQILVETVETLRKDFDDETFRALLKSVNEKIQLG